ncbi:MAG: patatin-like phospholipase family protein [Thermoplasmatota archaeon]
MKALVIEGGGMKAAYANGVLSAFEAAGFHPWDLVVGTSAGGALAAWYSAGQARYAEGTWAYAADPRILSYKRGLLRRSPILDHEALLEIVYREEHPLDVAAVQSARWPVIVTACNVQTGEVRYQDLREADVIAWLKATGRLPLASGPPVPIDGETWVDGGTCDPVPTRYALEQGATELVLITNKPPGPRRADPKPLVAYTSRRFPALRDGIEQHQERKAAGVQLAMQPPKGVTGHVLFPSQPTQVSRLSRDLRAIEAAIELGRADGEAFLNSEAAEALLG